MKKALKIMAYIVGGLILLAACLAFPEFQKFVVTAMVVVGVSWIAHNVLTTIIEEAVTKVVRRELGNMRAESYQAKDRLETIERQNQLMIGWLRKSGFDRQ
jgi:VIT1/CCC1 family predicted Fe2+/Mn2+ transporter